MNTFHSDPELRRFPNDASGVISAQPTSVFAAAAQNGGCGARAAACDPDRYPGTALRWGSSGSDVSNMQERLNHIAETYTAINTQTVDGKFGQNMYQSVIRFQLQLGLTADGVIGPATWERIVEVDRIVRSGGFTTVTTPYPGYVLGLGSTGNDVRFIQSYMSAVPGMTPVKIDGIFGSGTQALVRAFQNQVQLKADGLVGRLTWAAMIHAFNSLH